MILITGSGGLIGNAVSNAAGVRMTHVPMSPPRILQAIEEAVA